MATGDIKWFDQALLDLGNKIHDLDGDTLKLGIITSAVSPAHTTSAPHWGGTGTTNLSSNQVATGGSSYTGPITLANKSWSIVSNVPTFRADEVTLAQDASGFTNGRWGVIYNDSDANKRCIGFVDMGSDRSLVAGPVVFAWSGAGNDILTITQS